MTTKSTKSTKLNTTLVGELGRKLIITLDTKDGKFVTYATFIAPTGEKNAKGKNKVARQHGATQEHKTNADAVKTTDDLVKRALAGGWSPKSKRAPKGDAFDVNHIPSPRLVPVTPGQNMPVAKPISNKK